MRECSRAPSRRVVGRMRHGAMDLTRGVRARRESRLARLDRDEIVERLGAGLSWIVSRMETTDEDGCRRRFTIFGRRA